MISDLSNGVNADDNYQYKVTMGKRSEDITQKTDDYFEVGNLKERSALLDLETVAVLLFEGYRYDKNTTEKVKIINDSSQMLTEIENAFADNQEDPCSFVGFQEQLNPRIANITDCDVTQFLNDNYYEYTEDKEDNDDFYGPSMPYMKSEPEHEHEMLKSGKNQVSLSQ